MEIAQTQPMYRLLIIGANGGIGKQCVELALEAGHQVTAVVRNTASLAIKHHNLEVVKGDILQPETIAQYLDNKDAVISAIGTRGGFTSDKPTILYSQGSINILKLMKSKGVSRAFFISASAIEVSPVVPFYVRWAAKYILQKLLRNMYADLTIMETWVKKSNADWTIIRPPQLTDNPVTGNYRVAIGSFLKNGLKISRADLAHFIINNISNKATYKAIVEVGY